MEIKTVKVTDKGQISIPTSIRELAGISKGDELIIVISDGEPAAHDGYRLNEAIPDIHEVARKFKMFAFSIDAKGEYLNQLYQRNWVLTSSSVQADLGDKMLAFCRLIAQNFFR